MRKTGTQFVSPSIFARLSPKTISAIVLLSLMALLWLRLLLKKMPGHAAASTGSAETAAVAQTAGKTAKTEPIVTIRPRLLPVQPGYHDQLHCDPFDSKTARWLTGEPEVESAPVEIISPEEQERKMHRANLDHIAEGLTVEAILVNSDGSRKAFIGGKVVTQGGSLKVARNGLIYELTASEITDTDVVFTWQAFSITVHMSPSEWMEDGKEGVL